MSASLVAGATTPAHAAGGCADRSQNGWTIRLCASKNGLDLISDMYVIAKGQTGNGCRGEGHATSSGQPMGYLDLTGCANIAVNAHYVIASQWAVGGAQVTRSSSRASTPSAHCSTRAPPSTTCDAPDPVRPSRTPNGRMPGAR
ncbi:hypothetical protein ACIBQ6_11410 [Nonomuraea sp. NPDC049655]|uniref:hypothetical protein n=1 Tax=Nonomuraea sp. NPDC049655 TaxID=3364355 RepID=UPI0037879146